MTKAEQWKSHPTGVRGLKLMFGVDEEQGIRVAPHGGAWIETPCTMQTATYWIESHPTGVRGLKQDDLNLDDVKERRTPRGCVD